MPDPSTHEDLRLIEKTLTYGPHWPAATDALARLSARLAKLEAAEAALAEAREALERISEQQPKTLAMIEHNGFVFDSIGREPGNWQHLAFSIYTDLCEVDSIARAFFASPPEGETA